MNAALIIENTKNFGRKLESIFSNRNRMLKDLAKAISNNILLENTESNTDYPSMASELLLEDKQILAKHILTNAHDFKADDHRLKSRLVVKNIIETLPEREIASEPLFRQFLPGQPGLSKNPENYTALELLKELTKEELYICRMHDNHNIAQKLEERDLDSLPEVFLNRVIPVIAKHICASFSRPEAVHHYETILSICNLMKIIIEKQPNPKLEKERLLFRTISALPKDYSDKMNPLEYINLEKCYKDLLSTTIDRNQYILNNNLAILKYHWCIAKNIAMKNLFSQGSFREDLKMPLAHLEVAETFARSNPDDTRKIQTNIDIIQNQKTTKLNPGYNTATQYPKIIASPPLLPII